MTLPTNDLFEEFLAGSRVVAQPSDDRPHVLLRGETESVHSAGPALWVSYPDISLQLESVLLQIEKMLVDSNSPSNRDTSLAVLALIAETRPRAKAVEHANALLSEFREVQFHLNSLAPFAHPIEASADYGVLNVESFDSSQIKYWAKRGGSDWPIDPKQYDGCTAFSRRFESVVVLKADNLPGISKLIRRWQGLYPLIVDAYYQGVADELRKELENEFVDRISVAEAAGIVSVDLASILSFTTGIHLFTWKGSSSGDKAGSWAIMHTPGLKLNTPPGSYWKAAQSWSLSEFGFDELGDTHPIQRAASTYARLVQTARRHKATGNTSEAFLFFVIALDQLLGEGGSNTRTVVDRASVFTHRRRGTTYDSERTTVRRLYDLRSRFVHDGEAVGELALSEVDEVCRAVLWSILRVCGDEIFSTHAAWAARLDRLVHLLLADPEIVPSADFEEVGAVADFKTEAPPPMIQADV